MNDMAVKEQTLSKGGRRHFSFPTLEILLLLVAIFWGTSYGLTKQALVYTSVMMFIALRFSITFLSLLPIAVRDAQIGRSKDWKVALPTGIILATIFLFEVAGVFNTSASKAAFLISLSVIATALLEMCMDKKLISKTWFMLVISSVVGIFLLTSSNGIEMALSRGDYFILVAAMLRSVMVITTKKITQGKQISNVTLTCVQSFVVAASAICVMIFSHNVDLSLPTSSEFWLIIIYMVLCCTLFAFFVQNHAVRQLSPTKVSLLMGSEPLFGAIFAVIWLNESLSMIQMLGGGIIFISVMVASMSKKSS